jgi:hypothetical protein
MGYLVVVSLSSAYANIRETCMSMSVKSTSIFFMEEYIAIEELQVHFKKKL